MSSQDAIDIIQVKMQIASHVTEVWEKKFEERIKTRMLPKAEIIAAKRQGLAGSTVSEDELPFRSENGGITPFNRV